VGSPSPRTAGHGIREIQDIWIDPARDNPESVFRALARFGAALDDVSSDDFRDPDCVFQLGVEPIRVDLLCDIDGVAFDEIWPRRLASHYGSIPIPVISRDDLIANKRASGRPSDLRDIAELQEEQ
jgi:hypothetical protein